MEVIVRLASVHIVFPRILSDENLQLQQSFNGELTKNIRLSPNTLHQSSEYKL